MESTMPQTILQIQSARRIVIKVGSAVLASDTEPRINRPAMSSLAQQITALQATGKEIILVSSGAILAGGQTLGVASPNRTIGDMQALAAVGQVELMRMWRDIFGWNGRQVAQVLLTRDDLSHRRRFLNARRTMERLLERGVLPIVNENDTVMVEEIKFGDNDHLSALITNLVMADLLIILTEVEGVFDSDPRKGAARLLRRIDGIDEAIRQAAAGAGARGRGGMATKVEAARTASLYGVPTVIAHGRKRSVLRRILDGEEIGTTVVPSERQLDSRKHWIAFAQTPTAAIHVDEGAAQALLHGGKSLLPSGVLRIEGDFDMGDLVAIVGPSGPVGRGITSYSATEVDKIKGLRSSQIEGTLGYRTADEVIHRDYLVVGEENGSKL